jgi:hypothetical protein
MPCFDRLSPVLDAFGDSRCLMIIDYDRKIVIEKWRIMLLSGAEMFLSKALSRRWTLARLRTASMRSHNAATVGE